jgi:hypothetical protein
MYSASFEFFFLYICVLYKRSSCDVSFHLSVVLSFVASFPSLLFRLRWLFAGLFDDIALNGFFACVVFFFFLCVCVFFSPCRGATHVLESRLVAFTMDVHM